MRHLNDHFGIPYENIQAAQKAVRKYRNSQMSCHVPTRKEVLKLERSLLEKVLVNWMRNSTLEVVPSRLQIAEVLEVIRQRRDNADLHRITSMCQEYIRNQ